MTRKRSSESEFSVSPSAGVAPARRKTAANTRTRKKASETVVEVSSDAVATAPVEQTTESPATYQPTYAEIAALAYSLWEARGCQGGSPEEDWLVAEQQLRLRTA